MSRHHPDYVIELFDGIADVADVEKSKLAGWSKQPTDGSLWSRLFVVQASQSNLGRDAPGIQEVSGAKHAPQDGWNFVDAPISN